MSKSEKRYFSLDAQKSGKKGSRYLEVFRFLSDMDEFNDERLKKKFPKNLSSDKSYLYDAILRSMRDYRSTKSKSAQIKEKIQDSRYLFERGLYKQCDSRLQEANDIAKELGDELMILEVARERLLTIKSNKEKNFVEYVESLLEDKTEALANVNQFFKYSDTYYETIVKVTKNFQSPAEDRKQIVLPDFFEEEESIIESPQTLRRLYQSKALYYQLKGDKENLLKYFKKTADWWSNNPAYREEEYFRHTGDFFNLLYALFANRRYEEAKKYIDILKNSEPTQTHDKSVWLENVLLYELMYFINVKKHAEAFSLIEVIQPLIEKGKLTNADIIAGNIGILYFQKGNYKKCQDWLSQVIYLQKSGLRQDVQIIVRLLNLICLFENDEIEKLDNDIRSVQRFFKKSNINNSAFEDVILNKLITLFKANPYKVNQEKSDLEKFLSDRFKKIGSRDDLIEPLLLWLEPVKIV